MSDQRTVGPVSAETTASSRQRGRAIAGALSGVAVVVLLVIVFAVVRSGGDDEQAPPAAAPTASAPADPGAADAGAPSAPAEPPAEESPAEQPPAAGGADLDPALQQKPEVKAGEGGRLQELKVTPLIQGKGAKVAAGQQIVVNYVGATYAEAEEFDSSWQRRQPFPLTIGVGQVIPGWDQGLVGVNVGSRVQLDIPAELAYGENPQGGAPAGDLRFVVDILQAQ